MGEGDAGIGCGGECGGDAGDDLVRDLVYFELGDFFAAASEDERVATFEADDLEAFVCAIDEDSFDLILWMEWRPALLPT